MYFRWKDRRIVVKIAVWSANEGEASQFLQTLADAVHERVELGELEGSQREKAVGIRRNAEPIEVDESERRFSLFFCHPEGDIGEFEGHPVDYKLVAPDGPVEGNRAYDETVEGISGVIFIAEGSAESVGRNETALRALAARTFRDAGEDSEVSLEDVGLLFGTDDAPGLRILLPPDGSKEADPEAFRGQLALPDVVEVEESRPWQANFAWRAFVRMAEQIRPRLRRAAERGAFPTS